MNKESIPSIIARNSKDAMSESLKTSLKTTSSLAIGIKKGLDQAGVTEVIKTKTSKTIYKAFNNKPPFIVRAALYTLFENQANRNNK